MRKTVNNIKKLFFNHIGLFILIIILLPLLIHNFSYYPGGWDQIEYSWAVSSNYLPHSPYIAYFFTGFIFNLFFDAPIALSLISVISGLTVICLFYFINLRLFKKKDFKNSKIFAAVSIFMFSLSYLFIQQSTMQELYVFQTMLIMLTLFFIISKIKNKEIYGGITFGFLFAAHNSSIFFIPVLLYLLFSYKKIKKNLDFNKLLITSVISCLLFYFILYLIFPPINQSQKIIEFFLYLRGIAPGIEISNIFNFYFIKTSIIGLFERLTNVEPINLGFFHLIIFILGLFLSFLKNFRLFLFWIIYSLPYLLYEIFFGINLDYGLYVPFLFPSIFVFISYGFVSVWNYLLFDFKKNRLLKKLNFLILILFILILILLLCSSYGLIKTHWNDRENNLINHYSNTTLSAIWLSENVEENAIIIQPKNEWNVNIIPYYSNRRHIYHFQEKLMLFENRGAFTPLNENSFTVLTTNKLIDLINSNISVYSFEKNPLEGFNEGILEKETFVWQPFKIIKIDEIRSKIFISNANWNKLPRTDTVLYKCYLK
jgi:hypothetical protein